VNQQQQIIAHQLEGLRWAKLKCKMMEELFSFCFIVIAQLLSHPIVQHTHMNRIYNCLSPKWTTIFIVEHSTTKSWTPLKITIHDSKSKYNNSHATKNALQNIGKGDGGHDSTVYRSSDPIMGEVNVEVGEILCKEGQEARLELEPGGW
jgi:hypothetical protein